MKTLAIFLGCLLASASAVADFSGVWQGRGFFMDAEHTHGKKIRCSVVTMTIHQTETAFAVKDVSFECENGVSFSKWDYTLEIRNKTDLYWLHEKTGTITNNTVNTYYNHPPLPPQTRRIAVLGNHMRFFEQEVYPDGTYRDWWETLLSRQK